MRCVLCYLYSMQDANDLKKWPLFLAVAVTILLVVVGGYIFISRTGLHVSPLATNTETAPQASTTPSIACSGFDAFSQAILKTISDAQWINLPVELTLYPSIGEHNYRHFSINSTAYHGSADPHYTSMFAAEDSGTNFLWRRNSDEPFVEYSLRRGVVIHLIPSPQEGDRRPLTSSTLRSAVASSSVHISTTINQIARQLALVPNLLNTIPYQESYTPAGITGGDTYRQFQLLGFSETAVAQGKISVGDGPGLYSIVVDGEEGHGGGIPYGTITVMCGMPEADAFYNALNVKADPSLKGAVLYANSMSILGISNDGKIISLIRGSLGGQGDTTGGGEYSFDGTTAKLITSK